MIKVFFKKHCIQWHMEKVKILPYSGKKGSSSQQLYFTTISPEFDSFVSYRVTWLTCLKRGMGLPWIYICSDVIGQQLGIESARDLRHIVFNVWLALASSSLQSTSCRFQSFPTAAIPKLQKLPYREISTCRVWTSKHLVRFGFVSVFLVLLPFL